MIVEHLNTYEKILYTGSPGLAQSHEAVHQVMVLHKRMAQDPQRFGEYLDASRRRLQEAIEKNILRNDQFVLKELLNFLPLRIENVMTIVGRYGNHPLAISSIEQYLVQTQGRESAEDYGRYAQTMGVLHKAGLHGHCLMLAERIFFQLAEDQAAQFAQSVMRMVIWATQGTQDALTYKEWLLDKSEQIVSMAVPLVSYYDSNFVAIHMQQGFDAFDEGLEVLGGYIMGTAYGVLCSDDLIKRHEEYGIAVSQDEAVKLAQTVTFGSQALLNYALWVEDLTFSLDVIKPKGIFSDDIKRSIKSLPRTKCADRFDRQLHVVQALMLNDPYDPVEYVEVGVVSLAGKLPDEQLKAFFGAVLPAYIGAPDVFVSLVYLAQDLGVDTGTLLPQIREKCELVLAGLEVGQDRAAAFYTHACDVHYRLAVGDEALKQRLLKDIMRYNSHYVRKLKDCVPDSIIHQVPLLRALKVESDFGL